jgi:RNA polymerase sigma factor (TIGR02999 family)
MSAVCVIDFPKARRDYTPRFRRSLAPPIGAERGTVRQPVIPKGYIGRVSGNMTLAETADITLWLDAAREGDRGALDRVLATLYQELHAMARRQLAGQLGHTLDATALVHEAYLKLVGRNAAQFDDRAHFFAYAASAMRSVVVDYARQRLAQKRGGDLHRVAELPEDLEGGLRLDEDTLGLDAALTRLAAVDPRLAQVVELRYFTGLSELEIAALLKRSERSIRRDWQKARMFLLASLQEP